MRPRQNLVRTLSLAVILAVAGCGDDASTGPDRTPPGAVTDLNAMALGDGRYSLFWTAPGDDGETGRASSYDIRVSETRITAETWESAEPVAGAPTPGEVGGTDTLEVSGLRELGSRTVYLALRSADEVANWSGVSNVVDIDLADSVAPGTILRLGVRSATVASVTLAWTATGDDRWLGRALGYDLRMAESPITDSTWASTTRVRGTPAPGIGGTTDAFTVGSLESNRVIHFALRACDDGRNWSPISESVSATTVAVDPIELAGGRFNVFSADLSPDGSRIVFSADRDDFNDIELYVAPAGGGGATRLTTVQDAELRSPRWSPSGGQIAFVRADDATPYGPGSSSIWKMSATAGSAPVRLWEGALVEDLAWSPDGRRIAIVVRSPDRWLEWGYEVRVILSSGGQADSLAGGRQIEGLDWSPDGLTLAVGTAEGLLLFPILGGEPTRLSDAHRPQTWPSWSPDGREIAYAACTEDGCELWRAPVAGGPAVRLAATQGFRIVPDWSADGTRILFVQWPGWYSGRGSLWMVRLQ